MAVLTVRKRGIELLGYLFAITVIILVAAHTGSLHALEVKIGQRLALVASLVTIDALDLRMLALENEAGDIVLEGRDPPFGLRMAPHAIAALELRTEVAGMLILMTSQALPGGKLRPVIFDIVLAFEHVAFHAF